MIVVIFNEMPFPIHVAAVRVNAASIRFVFSKRRVPIPDGTVIGRMDVAVGEAVQTGELPDDVGLTCQQQELAETVGIDYEEGHAEDGTYLKRFHVRLEVRNLN